MIAKHVRATRERLLDAADPTWQQVPEETLALDPTPLGSQPSEYVRQSWQGRAHGHIKSLRVRIAHNGEGIFFRLEWEDDTKDDSQPNIDRFVDAAAILFPLKEDAVLTTMGDEQQPVNAWYWRPDYDQPFNVTATGLGTVVRHADGPLAGRGTYQGDGWQVVIARPFAVAEAGVNTVALSPGRPAKVGFAVWEGSRQERAGLKAVTLQWQELSIEE